jgi:hypothetical protein
MKRKFEKMLLVGQRMKEFYVDADLTWADRARTENIFR